MQKTILLTGATDGIGFETAKELVSKGHRVLLHGRNNKKLQDVAKTLSAFQGAGPIETYVADLSSMNDVVAMAKSVTDKHATLDVLINNAGIFKTPDPITADGLDVRFAVNTLAPYLLTQQLLPLMSTSGRVINLSSAAQAPVDLDALTGHTQVDSDFTAYAQSKLAITMWSRHLALELQDNGPVIVAVNPGSMLGTKMVKQGFGVSGADIRIGADILIRAAWSDEFANASGKYFDNDSGQFSAPHDDALDPAKTAALVRTLDEMIGKLG